MSPSFLLTHATLLGLVGAMLSSKPAASLATRRTDSGHSVLQSTVHPSMPLGWRSLADLQLPPKTLFDRAMPRYPNVWFFIDASLAPSYDAAVKLVTDRLRSAMKLREYLGPFDNPEGCDFEARLEHLQPWSETSARPLQHAHAFHIRYYYTALARAHAERVQLPTPSGQKTFYRFAASAHYEVEHFNPNHADVETCPICGRTGEYGQLGGNLVEMVHDPLGLELLVSGTIRGKVVAFEDQAQAPVGSVAALANLAVRSVVFDGLSADRNTLKIAGIVVEPAATKSAWLAQRR